MASHISYATLPRPSVLLKVEHTKELPGELVETVSWAPGPEILTQEVGMGPSIFSSSHLISKATPTQTLPSGKEARLGSCKQTATTPSGKINVCTATIYTPLCENTFTRLPFSTRPKLADRFFLMKLYLYRGMPIFVLSLDPDLLIFKIKISLMNILQLNKSQH